MTKEQFNEIKTNFGFYKGARVSITTKISGTPQPHVSTGIIKDWGDASLRECLYVLAKGRRHPVAIHYERLELLDGTLEDFLKNGIKITQESLDKFKKDAAAWRNEV